MSATISAKPATPLELLRELFLAGVHRLGEQRKIELGPDRARVG